MKTNSVPYSDQPPGATPDNTRVGNFHKNDGIANGYDGGFAVTGSLAFSNVNYLTNVGAYTSSPSYYGTFDQGGNVWEWDETMIVSSSRGLRGGSWDFNYERLLASERNLRTLTIEERDTGFRVASIPEPSTFILVSILTVQGIALLASRRSCR
jgi:hypothetical protein